MSGETDPNGSFPAPLDGPRPADPTRPAEELNDKHYYRQRFEHVVFGAGLERVKFEQCSFSGVRFSGAVTNVSFVRSTFEDAHFEEAILADCDFRYARFAWTTFARAEICGSDMYRCSFREGVVFEEAHIWCTSLHLADLSGSDLRWTNFCPPAHKKLPVAGHTCLAVAETAHPRAEALLVQEADEDTYERFLEHAASLYGGNEFTTFVSKPMLTVRRLADAALIYRRLAGRCAVAGQYRDESEAYVRAKELERQFAVACAGHRVEQLDRRRLRKPADVRLLYLRLLLRRLQELNDETGARPIPAGRLSEADVVRLRLDAFDPGLLTVKRCDFETVKHDLAKIEDDEGVFRLVGDAGGGLDDRIAELDLTSIDVRWLPLLDIERAKEEIIEDDLNTWGRGTFSPRRLRRLRTRSRAFGLRVIELATGYAESIWRVVATVIAIVVGTAFVLRLSRGLLRDGTTKPASFVRCLEAAFGNLAAQQPYHAHYGAGLITVLVSAETLAGIAAVGLLGFMLANRLRHA